MDWDDLRVLLAVREAGSATAAARKLGVDKATVSRRASALETALGVRLLVRRATGWSLTPAGERAANAARAMDRAVASLTSDFAGEKGAPRTTVSVTAPHWFCTELLLPALPEILAEAPWIDLAIAATSRVVSLPQREADVALRNARPDQGNFVVRKAGELGSALYAARSYAKRHAYPRDEKGWAELRLVGYGDRVTYVPAFRWLEEKVGEACGVTRTDDAKGIATAVRAGVGVGVIPCFLGDRDRELVRFGDATHRETIWLVSPAELAGTRAVKVASAFVAGVFRRASSALSG